MHFNMVLPGLEEVRVLKAEEIGEAYHLHVEVPKRKQKCPACGSRTSRVHDYRLQKIQHLKLFERTSYLFYRRRRYRCDCGKRFSEDNRFVQRYQRHTIEWNQALGLRVIQGKNFKDTADQFRTSQATVIRRFDHISASRLKEVEKLPPVIAIDEYKGDTNAGKYQLIIANGETKEPLDILPNRAVTTIKKYLREKGSEVKVVVMDMSHSFKSAVQKVLGSPIIVADRFHFSRYIHWALERVRRRVQNDFHPYDRKKCKRMKHIFHKSFNQLNERQRWYLERYLGLSEELRTAYALKEAYILWFQQAKEIGTSAPNKVKEGLYNFYRQVESSSLKEFHQAIQTFKNWQIEILNSFAFNYNNGFVEGLNNQTKVIKRNAFGFRRYDRFRLRVLLHHQFKSKGINVG